MCAWSLHCPGAGESGPTAGSHRCGRTLPNASPVPAPAASAFQLTLSLPSHASALPVSPGRTHPSNGRHLQWLACTIWAPLDTARAMLPKAFLTLPIWTETWVAGMRHWELAAKWGSAVASLMFWTFFSMPFMAWESFFVEETIWGVMLCRSPKVTSFSLMPVDTRWLASVSADVLLLLSTMMVDTPVTSAASPSPIPPTVSDWPLLTQVPEPGQGRSGSKMQSQRRRWPPGRWSSPCALCHPCLPGHGAFYALLKFLFHLRKLLQKPLSVQLASLEPVLVPHSQGSVQLVQIFT